MMISQEPVDRVQKRFIRPGERNTIRIAAEVDQGYSPIPHHSESCIFPKIRFLRKQFYQSPLAAIPAAVPKLVDLGL